MLKNFNRFSSTAKKSMKENKLYWIFGGLLFLLYFIIGYEILAKSTVPFRYDIIFGTDQKRVLEDIFGGQESLRSRAAFVHPLFILTVAPIAQFLKIFIQKPTVVVLTIQSFLASGSVMIIFRYIRKHLNLSLFFSVLLSLIYAFSATQFIFAFCAETFLYGGFFLILTHYLFFKYFKENRFNFSTLTILGVLTIAFTITNYIQFIILTLFLFFYRKRKEIKNFIKIHILTVISSCALSLIQFILFPSALMFFINPLTIFLGKVPEARFLNTIKLSFDSISVSFNNQIVSGLAIPDIKINDTGTYFRAGSFNTIFAIILFAFIVFCIATAIRKERKNPVYLSVLSCLGFNLLFHLIYSPSEILYSQNIVFLVIFLTAFSVKSLNNKVLKFISGIILTGILGFQIYNNFDKWYDIQSFVKEKYGIFAIDSWVFILAAFICVSCIAIFVMQKNHLKIKNIIVSGILLIVFTFTITASNYALNIQYVDMANSTAQYARMKYPLDFNRVVYFDGKSSQMSFIWFYHRFVFLPEKAGDSVELSVLDVGGAVLDSKELKASGAKSIPFIDKNYITQMPFISSENKYISTDTNIDRLNIKFKKDGTLVKEQTIIIDPKTSSTDFTFIQ